MRQPIKAVSLAAALAALAACGGQGPEEQGGGQAGEAAVQPAAPPAEAETPAEARPDPSEAAAPQAAGTPPPAFAQCRSCHAIEPGRHMIGPSLAGIFGTRAGDVAGYNFSTAMKESGLTWDEAALDRFLKAPQQVIPGTKMTYPGLKDDAKRAQVVAYIKTLK